MNLVIAVGPRASCILVSLATIEYVTYNESPHCEVDALSSSHTFPELLTFHFSN
jgi:hypothetical protein